MKITTEEAAAIMDCSAQFVRMGMQQGKLAIGDAIKMSSKWTYNISPALLAQRQGLTVEQLQQIINKKRAARCN